MSFFEQGHPDQLTPYLLERHDLIYCVVADPSARFLLALGLIRDFSHTKYIDYTVIGPMLAMNILKAASEANVDPIGVAQWIRSNALPPLVEHILNQKYSLIDQAKDFQNPELRS